MSAPGRDADFRRGVSVTRRARGAGLDARAAGALLVALFVASVACTAAPRGPSQPAARSSSPTVTEPVVVAVKGDWGAGTRAQRQITRRMCAMRPAEGFAIVMTTGDNFYPNGVAREQTYRHPERCLIRHPSHRWRASWGNHDGGDSTATLLGAQRYYRWSVAGVDFFALDSNDPTDPQQRVWLAEQLAASTAPLKVAYFHHPPFTAGSVHGGAPAVRNLWVPLFEQHDVALVLAGHNHLYERFLIEGTHYLTTGGGGAALYRCETVEVAPTPIRCLAEHHFLLLRVQPTRIEVRAIARDGSELDRLVVDRSGSA